MSDAAHHIARGTYMPRLRPSQPQITTPCPECGQAMVLRVNRNTGESFWGCSGWPLQCQHTQPLTEYQVKVARGDPRLPGM